MNRTYLSSDDSELLRKAVESFRGNSCMEMGIGYGSIVQGLKNQFQNVAGTDITLTEGFRRLKGRGIDLLITDRASCFRGGSFDLVVMNPPYLPSETIVDRTVDGGIGGFEVAKGFLQDALRVVRPGGTMLVVLSSESSKFAFERFCIEYRLVTKQVLSKSLFFETLTVFEIHSGDKV